MVIFFTEVASKKRKLRELKRGRLRIADILDLHGFTQTSTPTAITSFIASCHNPDNQCVMIITGKGINSPDRVSVVRATTLETLRKHPRVLAYCCSQPVDGGHGAFYILLRR
jgi:DNA-nicking Smr family endonuclease